MREPYYIEEQNLRFQGQYFDRETGLNYNTFRFYDPYIGRFTTPDPIGLAGGINLYQYAKNPVGYIDPLGLTPVDAPGYNVYGLYDLDINGKPVGDPYYVGITNDLDRRTAEHVDSGRLTGTRKTGLIPID